MREQISRYCRNWNPYSLLKVGFLLLFVLQVGVILYVNLVQFRLHLGYDSATHLLKAMEVWKQGTFYIDNWSNTTTLFFDNAMSLAALFYGLTRNIFLSYGLANILCGLVLLLLVYKLCQRLELGSCGSLICLNLFVCPYILGDFHNFNDLGYFSVTFVSMGAYAVKLIIIFLMVLLFIDLGEDKVNRPLLAVSFLLSIITGMSSGLQMIFFIIVPCCMVFGIRVLVKNSWKELLTKQFYFLAASTGFIYAGNEISERIFHYKPIDDSMVWVSASQFWDNLGGIFEGYLDLLGALPTKEDVAVLERQGIVFLCALFIAVLVIIIFVYAIMLVINKYETHENTLVFVMIAGINIIILALVYTTYGAELYESRYLIYPYTAAIFLVGIVRRLIGDHLIFKWLLVTGILCSVSVIDIKSDYIYLTTVNGQELEQIVEKIKDVPASVVYIMGDDLSVDQKKIRVMDDTKIYKHCSERGEVHHFGDYTYYDENGTYQGSTLMITTDEIYPSIPEYIRNTYRYYDHVDRFQIYLSDGNVIDNGCGLTKAEYNIDYPYTSGIILSNGDLDERDGSFLSDGTEGIVLSGPESEAEGGTYKITLQYRIISNASDDEKTCGTFSLKANGSIVGEEAIVPNAHTVVLEHVTVGQNDRISYEVSETEGSVMRIERIIAERVD